MKVATELIFLNNDNAIIELTCDQHFAYHKFQSLQAMQFKNVNNKSSKQ